jgi:hypothetical protein
MSEHTDKLLQECLAGLDAGLTPEDCLSAWPSERDNLEPLLRQAMLLRMAYAATPREEFRASARDKLMFMAGREAKQVLQVTPSDDFVHATRQRLLNQAGASAQEALRAVPPPRLAFWLNARRRLLEAGSSRPVPTPTRSGAMAYRLAMSAAVVVLAIAVAGLAYFSTQTAKPSVSAELASIEQQLNEIEQQTNAGNPNATSLIADNISRTVATLDKISPAQASSPEAEKAKELLGRQQNLVNQASADPSTSSAPEIQQARQLLNQPEVKIFAAGVSSGVTPVAAQTQPTVAPSGTSAAEASPSPPATSTSVVETPAVVSPLGPNLIRLRSAFGDEIGDLSWNWLETQDYKVLIPSTWTVVGPNFDSTGVARLDANRVFIVAPGVLELNINLGSGEIIALLPDGTQFGLREETALGGERVSVTELIVRFPSVAVALDHMLSSVVHTLPTPTPTALPPTATPSPPPTVTATP